MRFKPRFSLRSSLLSLAVLSAILAAVSAPLRQAARSEAQRAHREARRAHAAGLAHAALRANGWDVPRLSLRLFDAGDRAFRVEISRRGVVEVSRRGGPFVPSAVFVPLCEAERLVIQFGDKGSLSGARSEAYVDPDDLRIVEVARAE